MKIYLNVGHATNDGSPELGTDAIRSELEHIGKLTFFAVKFVHHAEGGEVTTIAHIETHEALSKPQVDRAVFAAAVILHQDCIAWVHPTPSLKTIALSGSLTGPKAGDWGTFNLDYFHFA